MQTGLLHENESMFIWMALLEQACPLVKPESLNYSCNDGQNRHRPKSLVHSTYYPLAPHIPIHVVDCY